MSSMVALVSGYGPAKTEGIELRQGIRYRWRTWLLVSGIYLLSRVPALVGIALAQRAESHPLSLLDAQHRWDGWWYLYLAEFGYPDGLTIVDRPHYGPWGFFPAWPMIIRFAARVPNVDYALAGVVVTTLFGVALALVLRRFAARYVGDRQALVVVALFLFFPGAVILSLPYTEAAFLFFAVLALDALTRERWILASLAVFGAASIRSTAVAVLVAVGVQCVLVFRRWWRSGRSTPLPWQSALPAVAGVAAFCMSFAYAYVRTGRPFIWAEAQQQWGQSLDFGIEFIPRSIRALLGTEPDRYFQLVSLGGLLLFIAIVAAGIRFRRVIPLPAVAYSLVLLGSIFLYTNVGPRPRMLLSVFPLFLPLGIAVTRRTSWLVPAITLAIFAGLSVLFSFAVLYTPLHVTA